jgi:hypothetical protein
MQMLIYTAGPFRGATPWDVEANVRTAEAAALEIAKRGHIPICVHSMYRNFDKSLPDEFWLSATMEILRACDALVLVGSWQKSTGAKAELAEANRLEKKIFASVDEIEIPY